MGEPSLVAAQHAAPAVFRIAPQQIWKSRQASSPADRDEESARIEEESAPAPQQRHAEWLRRGPACHIIVFALNDQGRAGNRAKESFNVPLAKLRIEPNVIPSTKHFVDMLVIARQFFSQVTGFIELANRDGAAEAELFDETCGASRTSPRTFSGQLPA